MKKHFINGLLILAMLFVSVGSFSSCKDSNEDDLAKIEVSNANLQKQIDALQQSIQDLKTALEGSKCACSSKWAELQETLNKLATKDELGLTQAEVETLKGQVSTLTQEYSTLQGTVTTLEGRIQALETYRTQLETVIIPEINRRLDELGNKLDNIGDITITIQGQTGTTTISEVINQLNALAESAKQTAQDALNQITILRNEMNEKLDTKVDKSVFDAAKSQLETAIGDLSNTIDGLKPDIQKGVDAWTWMQTAKNQIDAMETTISDLQKEIEKLQKKDTELETLINNVKENLQGQIDTIKTDLNNLSTKLDTEVLRLDGRIDELTGKVDENTGKIATLTTQLNDLAGRVAANETAIEELQNKMNKLTGVVDRLNKLVTSIIVQATNNPVIGSVNLPLDVNSNILLAQFGYAQTNFTFPSNSSRAEYNNEVVFTAKDIEMLKKAGNFKTLAISDGECLMDGPEAGKANAGTVYLTINPNNVDFTGIDLSLVNSQDTESAVKLTSIAKSNKILTFGVSKSASDNGFYEAQATVSEADLNNAKITLDKASLKTALKNAINNKTIGNLANLSVVLLNQFNGKVEANALKAAWQAPDGNGVLTNYATYSKYGLAAAAYNPLSFKFYYGQAAPSALRMPVITPITGNIIDPSRFQFHLDIHSDIKGDIKVDLGKITIAEDKVIITLTATTASGETITINGYAKDVKGFIEEIDKQLDAASADINAQIEKLVADINKQVEEMMNDVAGQINEQIKDIVADINAELSGKLTRVNNYIERYNQVAEKVNGIMENPNAYLQVMMCYKGIDGGWHQLSNSKDYPTVMNIAGGNAITLLPTTYTGEILASSYKKFIGVTNVWANGNEAVSAVNGDATCLSLLNNANTAYLMNQPITGQTHRVPFAVSKAGYTYEIVYSALDFNGYTSTRKFYVTVK